MRVLGIETSCDETGVALVDDGKIVASRLATQEVHSRWGGVVPEIASRLHQKTLTLMIEETLEGSGWSFSDLEGVAATRGPGLIGALLVGVSYAKGMAVAGNMPFRGVNHLEGHLWSPVAAGATLDLPAVAMIVSGGHTELIRVDGFSRYTFLGGTLDDAAGEAFDKVGSLLGIDYPAGAELSQLAEKGDPDRFSFPVPTTRDPRSFSFSGLKTAVLREIQALEREKTENWKMDVAASFQKAAIAQLSRRLECVLEDGAYKSVLLAGGVAANRMLRREAEAVARRFRVSLAVPPLELCTDNGAMIAFLGEKYLREKGGDPLDIEADPNLELTGDGA